MPISPQDYSLWSRMTGNRYPRTAKEKAAVGPAVKKFIQNMDKQGAQGGKSEEKSGKINISGKQIATGALGAGLIAGAVAVARRKGSRDAINEFLRNLGDKPTVKTYTRPNQGDITPPPIQQQSSAGMQPLSEAAYSALQQEKVTPIAQETPAFAAYKQADNTKPAPGTILGRDLSPEEKEKAKRLAEFEQFKINERSASKSNIAAIRQAQIESGNLRRTEFNIKNNDEPTGGAVVRKPAPKPPNLPSAASKEETAEEIMGPRPTFPIDDPARQKDLYANNPLQFEREVDQATKANMAYSDELAYVQEVLNERRNKNTNQSTSQKVDNFIQLTLDDIPTGVRTGQPKKVATDVTNTALGQNPDNFLSKPNKLIGEPDLKSKHDTQMEATQIIRDQRDIANFKNEQNKIYNRVLNQLTNGDPSKADARTERRASRLANKVINNDPGYQADRNRYHQAIKNTVSRDTEISAEDASFAAGNIFDEERTQDYSQAQTTGKKMPTATTGDEGSGEVLTRNMNQLRSVKNLETGQKTAIGRAIRGRARNLDQGELSQAQTRDAGASREEINPKTGKPQIISVSDESADVPGGLIGSPLASGTGLPIKGGGLTESVDVPVIVRTQKVNPNTGKSQIVSNVVIKQTTGALPLGEGTQARAPRGQVRKVVETPGDESKTDFTIEGAIRDESGKLVGGRKVPRAGSTLSGYSPYGRERGKFISGAMDQEGNYTNEAKGAVFVGPGQPLLDAGATFKDDEGKIRFLRNQPGAQQPRKPSEPIFENTGLTSREERNMGNIPSEQLRSRITTDRTGQLRKTARDARIELLSRGATIPAVPDRTNGKGAKSTINFTGASTPLEAGQRGPASSLQDRPPIGGSDPAVKKRIGADFSQIVNKGLQDINRTVAPDKRQAAIQNLQEKVREKMKTREAGGLIIDDIQNLSNL